LSRERSVYTVRKKKRKITQAVKTTPHNNQGKGATLVLSTVKLLHRKKRKGKSMGIKRFAGLA
jgi:hypothetical protein